MLHAESFYRVYPLVFVPDDAEIDDFVILGKPAQGTSPGQQSLILGGGCQLGSHTVIYAGSRIGTHLRTGHGVVIHEAVTIGDDVRIESHSIIGPDTTIGSGVVIGAGCVVETGATLAAGVTLGAGTYIAAGQRVDSDLPPGTRVAAP